MVPEVRYRGCTIEGYHHQFNMYIVRYIFGGLWGGGGRRSHAYIFHSFGLLCKSNNFANPVERGLGGWNPTHA